MCYVQVVHGFRTISSEIAQFVRVTLKISCDDECSDIRKVTMVSNTYNFFIKRFQISGILNLCVQMCREGTDTS